jgi:hypothetical protein
MAGDARPTQTAMEGAGYYNKHSSLQAAGIAPALALLKTAASEASVGDETLVIADYGSSQGRNSMTPMRLAIETLRSRCGADRPALVIHTDLPSNDFTSLFDTLNANPASYLAGSMGIFSAAVGRSFYEAILPPGVVHFGWSSWAVQWLSQKSVDAPDAILPPLSGIPSVRVAASRQSALDWERFLAARASELRTGGRLLCLIIASPQPENTNRLLKHLWDSIVEAGREGLLTELQQLRTTIPQWFRSLAELKAPFAAEGQFAGLRLEHIEAYSALDPFWASFEQTGDAAQFANSWANTMWAVCAPTIRVAIGADRGDLLDSLRARYAARIAAAPKRIDWNLAALVIAKTA